MCNSPSSAREAVYHEETSAFPSRDNLRSDALFDPLRGSLEDCRTPPYQEVHQESHLGLLPLLGDVDDEEGPNYQIPGLSTELRKSARFVSKNCRNLGRDLDNTPQEVSEIVRDDLFFLVDPAPQFPRLRTIFLLTSPLDLEMGAFTNELYLGQSESSWISWEFKASTAVLDESQLEITRISLREKSLETIKGSSRQSHASKSMGVTVAPTPHPVDCPMSFLTWNARGIARPSFESNNLHLAHHHRPNLLFVCETRTLASHTQRFLGSL